MNVIMVFCALSGSALRRALSVLIVPVFIPGLFALMPAACADTTAQTRQAIQAVCDQAAASYGRRYLPGFMAMYAPDFFVRNVKGSKATFRQVQSGMKILLAKNGPNAVGHCTVSQVVLQGNEARATVQWHYVIHRLGSATTPAYTIERGYKASAVWKKFPEGWKETSMDVTHDYLNDHR